MTNTVYLYNTIRDDDSVSSTTTTQESPATSNRYTPPGMNPQPIKTDEKDLSETLYSPSCQCSTFNCFDFAELKAATRNFRPSAVLAGTLGSMYKGWVDEHKLTATKLGLGIPISVKFLNQEGSQDPTKWLEEVTYLGHLHHPNLVRLLGYCLEGTNRLLVYEFTSRASLENRFEGPIRDVPLSLSLNVALDAAKGLAFLHSSKVVHGYFKPSNVLLDSNYNAKLFGFGLTKNNQATFPIGVWETPYGYFGHMTVYDAPEYLRTGHFSAESDVYSFGVVFLEILFRQRAFDDNLPGRMKLVERIRSHPNLKPKFVDALDSCTYDQLKSGLKAVKLALQCLSLEVKFRPTMDEVVKTLEQLQN